MFWTHLQCLIGVNQRLSSAYHPQTDGATEQANQTVGQMLQACIGPRQRDWVARLPVIEFAIKSSRSEMTGYAPFFLNSGQMPHTFIWNNPSKDEYPSVHDAILGTRVKQTRNANWKRQLSPFVEGDLIYVSTENMSLLKGLARKLAPKYIGPYIRS